MTTPSKDPSNSTAPEPKSPGTKDPNKSSRQSAAKNTLLKFKAKG